MCDTGSCRVFASYYELFRMAASRMSPEKILAYRVRDNHEQYLVKFFGSSSAAALWLTAGEIRDQSLINTYRRHARLEKPTLPVSSSSSSSQASPPSLFEDDDNEEKVMNSTRTSHKITMVCVDIERSFKE
jgi:hypothetical protein